MRIFTLERKLTVAQPLESVFPFFAEASNLERMTPPWLRFRVMSRPPIVMEEGAEIEYWLKLRGIPFRWTSRIQKWAPPHEFVDEQIKGPYRLWVHTHTFENLGESTCVRDRVRYSPPGGFLIHRLFLKRELKRVFDYRAEQLKRVFEVVEEL